MITQKLPNGFTIQARGKTLTITLPRPAKNVRKMANVPPFPLRALAIVVAVLILASELCLCFAGRDIIYSLTAPLEIVTAPWMPPRQISRPYPLQFCLEFIYPLRHVSSFMEIFVMLFLFLPQAALIVWGGLLRFQAKFPPNWFPWLFKAWIGVGAGVWCVALLAFRLEAASMGEFPLSELPILCALIWIGSAPAFLLWWAYFMVSRRRKLADSVFVEAHTLRITPTHFLFADDPRKYEIRTLSSMRVAQSEGTEGVSGIRFDENGERFAFGAHFASAEAQWLVDTLQTLVRFRCHEIEQIVFGKTRPAGVAQWFPTLFNPDVSALTLPFWRLQRIVIIAKDYDFRLVERFLIYALNVIGQGHLKLAVEVVIYGVRSGVQTNLYNNLMNTCAQVTFHPMPRTSKE